MWRLKSTRTSDGPVLTCEDASAATGRSLQGPCLPFAAGVLVGAAMLLLAGHLPPGPEAAGAASAPGGPHRAARSLLSLKRPVAWPGAVLPENIVDVRLPMVWNPHYGLHVFALGKNGSLWHKFQTGPVNESAPMMPTAPMSEWQCLTPNATLVWGNDPTVALNADGRIELFVGLKADSLDLWQMYQTDARNPLAWTTPRGPTCMCDAVSPTACPWCMNCNERPECYKNYWLDHAPFTTSDPELMLDKTSGKLKLYFRNFDGHLYQLSQQEPSNSSQWSFDSVQYAIME